MSEKAGRWFVSLQVQEDILTPNNSGPVAGLDLGIRSLATVSDGVVFNNPKALNRFEKKVKRFQRQLARRINGSKNWEKSIEKLRKTHSHIANIWKDALHKITTSLTKTKSILVIENLHVNGMRKNHRFAKSISDTGFSEFQRQLEYKAFWYGSKIIVAPRIFSII